MKGGRASRWDQVPAPVQRAVLAAIDARALSSRAIHQRYNLTRWVPLSTFRKRFAARRKERAARRRLTTESAESAEKKNKGVSSAVSTGPLGKLERLIDLVLDTAHTEIAAGRIGKVKLSSLLGELKDIMRFFKVTLLAEQRAQELHQEKMGQLRKAVDQATEQGTRSVTRAEIFDQIDKVMRGEAA